MRHATLLLTLALLAPLPAFAGEGDSADALIAQLRSRYLREREAAADALVQCGPKIAPRIASLLDDADARVQRAAVDILSRLGTPEAIAPLLPLLSHPDPTIRAQVHDAFRKQGRTVRPSLELAREKGDEKLAQSISDLLKEMTQADIEDVFGAEVMDDGSTGYYSGQFAKLKELGPDVGPMLTEMVKPDFKFNHDRTALGSYRSMAIQAIADIGYREAIPDLQRIAEEPSLMSQAAAGSLWRLGQHEAADKLEAALKEGAGAGFRPGLENASRLAELYSRTDQYEKALDMYRESVAGGGRGMATATTYYNMSCTLARMGRKKEATESLRRAVQQGFRNAAWMKKDGDLDGIREEAEYKAIVKELGGENAEQPPSPAGGSEGNGQTD